MKLFFDFFPILLFFIAYKMWNIFVATGVAIAASFIWTVSYWLIKGKPEKMHVITLLLLTFLGGATLLLHDAMFIKWKPTALYWIFALVFFGSQYIGKRSIVERMMQTNINLPRHIWTRLNFSWVLFFTLMGFANLYVVYNFNTNTWVNFKLFGTLGLTLVFVILQAFYVARHVQAKEDNE